MSIEKNRKTVLAALRSGEYAQTFGDLEKDGCFCALGLIYEVTPPPYFMDTLLGDNTFLSSRIIRWNDSERLSFEDIADRLEDRWSTSAAAPLGTGTQVLVGDHEVLMGEARVDDDRLGRVCGYGLDCHGRAYVVVEWMDNTLEIEYL